MSLPNTHLVNLSLFLQLLLSFPPGNLLARKTNERTRETKRQKQQTGEWKEKVMRLINVKNRGMNVKTTAFKSAKLKTHKRTDREREMEEAR